MCQRDYHGLLFTVCWLWYPACAGVGACLFPCITRAVSQPARSYSVWKLEAIVAQVELPPSHIAEHGLIKQARLSFCPVRALVRLAPGDGSQSVLSPRRGSVRVLFGHDIVYMGKRRVKVSWLYCQAV